MKSNGRDERFETFVTWYLRFNGYFTVPSFYVHAGDDPNRISGDTVGNVTEVDTLAIRLPHSREESGTRFPIDQNLVGGAEGRTDVVVAEVKSGGNDSPNRVWREGKTTHVEYLLRFIGWHKDEHVTIAATKLSKAYVLEEAGLRMRYIVFSERVDNVWQKKGVRYITFDECIQFISEERGQCWAHAGIGRRSMHDRWNPLVRRLFQVANDASLDASRRKREIWKILDKGFSHDPETTDPPLSVRSDSR